MSHSLVDKEYPVTEIPDIKNWGENYVVQFYDPENGVGSLLSLGRWVIQPNLWRNMSFLSLPNDRVLVSKNYGPSIDPKIAFSGLFSIEILEPGRKLRYRYDGPADERTMTDLNTVGMQVGKNDLLQFDLVFESDYPVWDMHKDVSRKHGDRTEDRAANYNSPEGHIEQNGYMTGTITYGNGETYLIKNAPATRDHSRGVRDLTRYKSHIWANGIFRESDRSFHMFVMKTHGFDGIAAGRVGVIIDGKIHDVEFEAHSGGWFERAGQLFQPFVFNLKGEKIGSIEIEAHRLINSVPLAMTFPADHYWSVPAQTRLKEMIWVNEQKVHWRWDGEDGYGHLERGNTRISSTDADWLANFTTKI